ncbi:MAG: hypothetical protein IT430_14520 [Phycisphaerales bacterium]|nr:hypothetical protein [Phycisphaerales bacterium]
MSSPQHQETAPTGFDSQGWPLPEVRSMMVDNFVRSWTQHWLAVVLLFVVSMGIVLFAAWLVTPTWEGQATMEIHSTPMPTMSLESGAMTDAAPLTANQLVKNLVEQTRSLSFLREVVERSGLDDHLKQVAETPPNMRTRIKKTIAKVATLQFLRGDFKVDYVAKAMDELTSAWLSITPTEGSTIIPIYVYGDSPKITRQVGDTIMDLLQERTDAALRAGVERQLGVLEGTVGEDGRVVPGLIQDAQLRVAENDARIQDARTKYEFFDPETYAQSAQETAQSLRNEKTTFQLQDDTLSAKIATLEKQLAEVPEIRKLMQEGVASQPDNLLSSRIEIDIADTKAEIAQKKASQGPNSPAVQSLEVKLKAMEQSLADAKSDESKIGTDRSNVTEQVDPKYLSLFNSWIDSTVQLNALRARVGALDQAIAALTEMQHSAVKADIELKRMQREAIADEEQLKQLTTQARQLHNLLAGPRLFNGVVSRTDTQVLNENKNDYPSMLLAALLALLIAAFAALVLPIAYDYLNQTLLSSQQVSAIPGVRVVASVPSTRSNRMFTSV